MPEAQHRKLFTAFSRSDSLLSLSLSLSLLIEIPFYILSLSASNFDTAAVHVELRVTLIRRVYTV